MPVVKTTREFDAQLILGGVQQVENVADVVDVAVARETLPRDAVVRLAGLQGLRVLEDVVFVKNTGL